MGKRIQKCLALAALMCLCLALLTAGSSAYFTSVGTARNTVTAGNIRIELVETAIPPTGGAPVPFTDPVGVMPGTSVSKRVQVKNTGDQSAYIRVGYTLSALSSSGAVLELEPAMVSVDENTSAWTRQGAYCYYNSPLAPGETTQPVFTSVSFSPDMGNAYQDMKLVVTVNAAATQTANNGASALTAAGWPAA